MQAMSDNADVASFLSPLGYQSGSCGYCKGEESSQRTPDCRCSYYVKAKRLHVDHYQMLVDRGWRRSGNLVYKPDPRYSCCPHYTIRLPAVEFKPRKDQKQAVNRWNKYVLGDAYIDEVAKKYPKSKAEKKAAHTSGFDLVTEIHSSESTELKKPPEPSHEFTVTIEPDTFTQEKYNLFKAYQEHVHKDFDNTPTGFRRFLCSTPLNRITRQTSDGKQQQLGSYHQVYRLDGRLIAMGVLDLLPHCVSGVYFIYHPDFEKWSFGKISALREAALALEGGYRYYYMGYYIHNCPKMRYKNDYRPQYFLDYANNEWNMLDEKSLDLMDRKKYVSLSQERRLEQQSEKSGDEKADEQEEEKPKSASEVTESYSSGTSLFMIGLPGMLSVTEVTKAVDMDAILVKIPRGQLVPSKFLVGWEEGSVTDPLCLKGTVAEMMACLGSGLAREVIVDFSD